MDTATHALTGYVLSRAGLNRNLGKWGDRAAVAAAIFPDLDLVSNLFGTEAALRYHRSLTNSVFLAIPFSLLFAWGLGKISGLKKFWSFFWIWLAVTSVHNFQDLMTSYGTMILSPFSDRRFSLDWVFIIDPYLVATLLVPLIFAFFWKKRGTTLARVCLGLAVLYIGLCAGNHSRALSLAGDYAREKGLEPMRMASLPQPLSPFRWENYLVTEQKIYHGGVNLICRDFRQGTAENSRVRSLPNIPPIPVEYVEWERFEPSPWVEKARGLDGVKTFFWFARFPVVQDRGMINGVRRVEFFDLRFRMLGRNNHFSYAVDFDGAGKVIFQGFL
jgi:inner membrane protein